jgi:hypothetical protein
VWITLYNVGLFGRYIDMVNHRFSRHHASGGSLRAGTKW